MWFSLLGVYESGICFVSDVCGRMTASPSSLVVTAEVLATKLQIQEFLSKTTSKMSLLATSLQGEETIGPAGMPWQSVSCQKEQWELLVLQGV